MIVILSGSPKGTHSKTTAYAVRIAEATQQPYRIFDAATLHIKFCTGCEQCFTKGCCPVPDDLPTIIEALREADAVILASPVYASSMTGQMKTLLDRLSVHLHLMLLIGVPAVTLTTSSSSYHRETEEQLNQILEFLGASVVSRVALSDRDKAEPILEEAGQQLAKAMKPDATLPVAQRTRTWFHQQQRKYRALLKIAAYFPEQCGEAFAWEKQGYTEYADIDAAILGQREKKNRLQ